MPAQALQNTTLKNYKTATGPIPFGMTNDYMFRAVLESNPIALKGLICALLHLQEHEITSVEILNPIALGDSFNAKDMILDVKVCINKSSYINLEMQISKQEFWPERSLTYLCRSFDNLSEGDSYLDIKPAFHFGFLDYDIFPNEPEFYATYHMANDISHKIYTSKFTLSVVSLNRIDLATDEDRKYKIDYWAKLFKATTWEEIQMIAEKDHSISEAAETMFKLSEDDLARERCWAREEHYRIMRSVEQEARMAEERLARAEDKLADTEGKLADTEGKLADTEGKLADTEGKLADANLKISQLEAQINALLKNNVPE